MSVKNKLLEIRLSLGYKKQKDFAEFLGIGNSYYSKLENNKDKLTIDTLFNIANKLNININDIVYYEKDSQE
ncbi:helix-turn-helix transcriptional regulator [Clostridium botulinum]|nr:helix-turn-helix transcriptional regulator [Clostridium botulinum]NFP30859.1 helix-turn-helix transcriptional regulator [Clostridium botulinum]